MASVDVSQLSKAEHDELACAYAALLLHDGEIEITVSKEQTLKESTVAVFKSHHQPTLKMNPKQYIICVG